MNKIWSSLSVRWKFTIPIGFLFIIIISMTFIAEYFSQKRVAIDLLSNEAQGFSDSLSAIIASDVKANDVNEMNNKIKLLKQHAHIMRSFITNINGKIIASSDFREIGKIVEFPMRTGLVRVNNNDFIRKISPIINNEKRVGYAINELSSSPLNEVMQTFATTELLTRILSVFLFFGLTVYGVNLILSRLDSMVLAAKQIQYGNLKAKASETYNDEISYVSKTFNNVTEHLRYLMEQQKNIALTLQKNLLNLVSHKFAHLDISVDYKSATKEALVGGDFYDVFKIDDKKVGVVIGDVSGKGIEAATHTSIIKHSLRALAFEGLEPQKVMTSLNRIVSNSISPNEFITMVYAVFDFKENSIIYCNAGHLPLIYMKRYGDVVSCKSGENPALGLFDERRFIQNKLGFDKSDVLFLYTDGLTEARHNSEFYGVERLMQNLSGMNSKDLAPTSEEILKSVERSCLSFSGGKLSDDLALIALKIV